MRGDELHALRGVVPCAHRARLIAWTEVFCTTKRGHDASQAAWDASRTALDASRRVLGASGTTFAPSEAGAALYASKTTRAKTPRRRVRESWQTAGSVRRCVGFAARRIGQRGGRCVGEGAITKEGRAARVGHLAADDAE
jgi:hypothetical protein